MEASAGVSKEIATLNGFPYTYFNVHFGICIKKKTTKKKQRNLKELSVFIFTGVLPIF